MACSDSESEMEMKISSEEVQCSTTKAFKRHSVAQVAHLNHMYEMGMKSCSKDNEALISKAACDTKLTTVQVKV